jgi:cardiolipin synthase
VFAYLPNLLTVWRVAAAPVLVLLLKDQAYALALVVFILAGISDGLDGYIAKRFGCESRLGAILDPVADKLLLISCFGMLTFLEHLPFWLLVVVVFRDVLIVGGYLMLVTLNGSVTMNPSNVSKINTAVQILLIVFVLAELAGWLAVPPVIDVFILIVTVTTVWSGAHYVWFWGFRRDAEATRQATDS